MCVARGIPVAILVREYSALDIAHVDRSLPLCPHRMCQLVIVCFLQETFRAVDTPWSLVFLSFRRYRSKVRQNEWKGVRGIGLKRQKIQNRRNEQTEPALNGQEEFMNIPSLDPQTLEGAISAVV